jgi:hypothetical protein
MEFRDFDTFPASRRGCARFFACSANEPAKRFAGDIEAVVGEPSPDLFVRLSRAQRTFYDLTSTNSEPHRSSPTSCPKDHHGRILSIRKATTPEPEHRQIYATPGIPAQVMQPVKTWQVSAGSDPKKT